MMDQLNTLIEEIFRIPANEMNDDTDLKELKSWDSLRYMELIMTVEETYKIQLEAHEILSMTHIGTLRKILLKKQK